VQDEESEKSEEEDDSDEQVLRKVSPKLQHYEKYKSKNETK